MRRKVAEFFSIAERPETAASRALEPAWAMPDRTLLAPEAAAEFTDSRRADDFNILTPIAPTTKPNVSGSRGCMA
ncbi:hypothetical protein [Bosea sp. (in: a-proteobacteria)]